MKIQSGVVWVFVSALWAVVVALRLRGRRADTVRHRQRIAELEAVRTDRVRQGAREIRARVPGRRGEWSVLGTYEVSRSSLPAVMPWVTLANGVVLELENGGHVDLADGVQLQALFDIGRSISLGTVTDGTAFRYELPCGSELYVLGVSLAERGREDLPAYRVPGAERLNLAPVRSSIPGWPDGAR